MPQAGREKSMEEILEQVQREYAEQAKQELQAQTSSGAQDAEHDTSNGAPDAWPNWEKLTRADVEQARRRVACEREAVLSRQTAELKELDTEQHAIEQLERLIAAFAEKHGGPAQSEP
jgi:hypothetical protein